MSNALILPAVNHGPTVILTADLLQQVAQLDQRMGELPVITDQPSADAVRALMNDAGKLRRQLDAQRLNAKQPWADIAKAIDAAVRPILDRLEALAADAKEQLTDFAAEQDRRKAEAENAARIAQAAAAAALAEQQRQAAATPAATPGAAPAQPFVMPQLQVTSLPDEVRLPTQRRKTVRLLDVNLIPREFWDLNTERVRRALLDGRTIPGAELVEEIHVVNR